jgi:hypothetical protein
MSTKSAQTRRSVSISGKLYEALRSYGKPLDLSMSEIIEEEMRRFLKMPSRADQVSVAKVKEVEKTPEAKQVVAVPVKKPAIKPAPEPKPVRMDKPWVKAGFKTREEWRADQRKKPKPPTDLEFNKMVDEKLEEKKVRHTPSFSPFYNKKPKRQALDPALNPRGVIEPPKVLEKPDTSKFDEWEREQPKAKVESIEKRVPQSNIVLL